MCFCGVCGHSIAAESITANPTACNLQVSSPPSHGVMGHRGIAMPCVPRLLWEPWEPADCHHRLKILHASCTTHPSLQYVTVLHIVLRLCLIILNAERFAAERGLCSC